MSAQVPTGVGPPVTLTQSLGAGNSQLDMTTVTAVTLLVRLSNGTTATWGATILGGTYGATAGGLIWQHVFSTTDCPTGITGAYLVAPQLTAPYGATTGTVPLTARQLIVTDPFAT
jgi:hypothetical protein